MFIALTTLFKGKEEKKEEENLQVGENNTSKFHGKTNILTLSAFALVCLFL